MFPLRLTRTLSDIENSFKDIKEIEFRIKNLDKVKEDIKKNEINVNIVFYNNWLKSLMTKYGKTDEIKDAYIDLNNLLNKYNYRVVGGIKWVIIFLEKEKQI